MALPYALPLAGFLPPFVAAQYAGLARATRAEGSPLACPALHTPRLTPEIMRFGDFALKSAAVLERIHRPNLDREVR